MLTRDYILDPVRRSRYTLLNRLANANVFVTLRKYESLATLLMFTRFIVVAVHTKQVNIINVSV